MYVSLLITVVLSCVVDDEIDNNVIFNFENGEKCFEVLDDNDKACLSYGG